MVGLPLVVVGENALDDGTGTNGWLFFRDGEYRRVGTVFDNPELLFPLLETEVWGSLTTKRLTFDAEGYGFVDFNTTRGPRS
jgi:hypothetical protein